LRGTFRQGGKGKKGEKQDRARVGAGNRGAKNRRREKDLKGGRGEKKHRKLSQPGKDEKRSLKKEKASSKRGLKDTGPMGDGETWQKDWEFTLRVLFKKENE